MKRIALPLTTIVAITLSACTSVANQPTIEFIGVSEGTLQTGINDLEFAERFEVDQRDLVGVVAFSNVAEGTEVMATWFSPDDRRMPMGRTTIETQSGAKIARFSLSSTEDWQPAPYMLDIRANYGEGEHRLSASGAVQFFIGMTDEEIREYYEAYAEWERRENERKHAIEVEREFEQGLIDTAKARFESENGLLVMRRDLTGNGTEDYVIIDTENQDEYMPSQVPGVPLASRVNQAAIVDKDGTVLLSLLSDGGERQVYINDEAVGDDIPDTDAVNFTIVSSNAVIFEWFDGEESCTVELRYVDGAYVEHARSC